MSNVTNKRMLGGHLVIIYLLSIILVIAIWYYEWLIGLIMAVLLAVSIYYSIQREKKLQEQTETYIATLSYRVKKVGEEALLEMPIGIILYNDEFQIEWSNPYMNQFGENQSLAGKSLENLSEKLVPAIKEGKNDIWVSLGQYDLQTTIKPSDRLLYFFDRTEQAKIESLYYNEQPVIAIIYLDNYEEITQNMDDTTKSQLNSRITAALNNWAEAFGLFLKRTSQERFMAIITQEILERLEKSKFEILDEVRELVVESGQKNPVTLSIGIGVGNMPLPELGKLAQSSLDLALGRGGDQIAIRDESGKVRFYGGKTNPMEKRTRVRARVISHALRELIKESDNVIIMGHKAPDMDSLGSSIGILNIAKSNEVEGYIVFDEDDVTEGVQRIVEAIRQDEELWESFVDPDEAEAIISSRSLVVIVDTHRPAMVADRRLLNKTEYKVVIDHHRRGEDFIEDPTLVYMEPYASSTSELVTELLEYQPKRAKLKILEATALLAGIIVDTKSFALRTGSRTFDAASYLRSKGADNVKIQHFLKEDISTYVKRSQLIERVQVYRDSIAITKAKSDEVYSQILIAQAADTLLTMNNISASFVICKLEDGKIAISARSLGEVNVQVIMERMAGGGHLTNAATQIEDTTIDDAEGLLKEIIDEYYGGRESE
ncbi:DHH family phosphoesterase [Virgibacillus sp. W0181]|uniref:DHH family phosphoesterase n=1 Tax=Virgibacillus sp. W0181 TaxID=3391581 RepID=UPI003F483393